jgi:hypothetical protein
MISSPFHLKKPIIYIRYAIEKAIKYPALPLPGFSRSDLYYIIHKRFVWKQSRMKRGPSAGSVLQAAGFS